MRHIKDIAISFLSTDNKLIKEDYFLEAEYYLKTLDIDNLTPAKILKNLGLSYFLGRNTSSKIEKGLKKDIDTYILYLSASNNAGFELCPNKTIDCAKACLVEAGRAGMESQTGNIHVSRLVKSWIIKFRKDIAFKLIQADINRAKKRGRKFAIRLNGTSDIAFKNIINAFNGVQFYDYTKNLNRALKSNKNHHITFSFSGYNIQDCLKAAKNKNNIAVPIIADDFEAGLKLHNVFNGDDTDLRYLDKQKGQICLLKVKGNNIKKSAFIMNLKELKQLSELIG